MDVILKQLAFYIGQILRDIQAVLLLQGLDGLLDFLEASLCLQLSDHFLNLILRIAPECTTAFILIVFSHLGTQMTASGVDNQEQSSIFRTIYFNEVVTAAQRTNATHSAIEINLVRTVQLGQIDFSIQSMQLITHLTTVGDLLADQLIQLGKVDLTFNELHSFHAAADIDPNHTGNDLILDGHCGTNRAALTCMYVRHNADLTTGKLRLVANRLDLICRQFLQLGSIANGSII